MSSSYQNAVSPRQDLRSRQDTSGAASHGAELQTNTSEVSGSAVGRAGTLPLELTGFVGRRQQVMAVRRLISESRLVTLTGQGGIGKTRLATRAAAGIRRPPLDGVHLVELDRLRGPALLVPAVAAAMGIQPTESSLDVLLDRLATRRVLLILDNCEHLIDDCAKLVDRLVRQCPQVRVLTTSREPLNIAGEVTFTVLPLSLPAPGESLDPPVAEQYEAIRLFVDCARQVVPTFRLTEDSCVAVAGICQRLEGVPLLIELAAARLAVLQPGEILRRLTPPYRVLAKAPRPAPARHQTAAACVRWSYDLCTEVERRAWARLATFPGEFDLDAAEAVAAANDLSVEDVFDVVDSLVRKSILVREVRAPVFRFRLPETMREFGKEKLRETTEHAAVRRRLRDHCARLVRQMEADWIGSRQAHWLARLDQELPNLRAALDFCFDEPGEAERALHMLVSVPHSYWASRGLLAEGRSWLSRALDEVREPGAARARGLFLDTQLSISQGAFHPATMDEAWRLARRSNDPRTLAYANYVAGLATLWNGEPPAAKTLLWQAFLLAADGVDLETEIASLAALITAHTLNCDTEAALACYQGCLERTRPRGESLHRGYAEWAVGVAAWRAGDLSRAQHHQRHALQRARDLGDRLGTSCGLETLAWIDATQNRHRRAATLLAAAAAGWQALGASLNVFPALNHHHVDCEQRAHTALGDAPFEAATRHGHAMTTDDAIAYALHRGSGPPPTTAATSKPPPDRDVLSEREREVAGLVAEGLTNKQIAARLVIAPRTADTHVGSILSKLGYTSRTQVALWAAQQPVLDCPHRPSTSSR